MDISDLIEPRLVLSEGGAVDTYWRIAVADHRAYPARPYFDSGGLYLRCSAALEPLERGRFQLSATVRLDVRGGRAFLRASDRHAMLTIVDVSRPETPARVDDMVIDGKGTGVAVTGGYALVTRSDDGGGPPRAVMVVDTAKLEDPTVVDSCEVANRLNDLALDGGFS